MACIWLAHTRTALAWLLRRVHVRVCVPFCVGGIVWVLDRWRRAWVGALPMVVETETHVHVMHCSCVKIQQQVRGSVWPAISRAVRAGINKYSRCGSMLGQDSACTLASHSWVGCSSYPSWSLSSSQFQGPLASLPPLFPIQRTQAAHQVCCRCKLLDVNYMRTHKGLRHTQRSHVRILAQAPVRTALELRVRASRRSLSLAVCGLDATLLHHGCTVPAVSTAHCPLCSQRSSSNCVLQTTFGWTQGLVLEKAQCSRCHQIGDIKILSTVEPQNE